MDENTPIATLEGLALLRAPFPAHQISQLPKGGVMLSYVGHAALTDRLLDADPCWNWEPLHIDPATGLPALDAIGGLWIKLTVCGVTRLGYGDAGDKKGCNAMKERIGDCLITGTLITTARGDVPIESVQVGDMVPTRAGWRRVTDHWLSAKQAPVVTVKLSNGQSITGTPHHKVPTANGVKRLAELRNGDIMHAWQDIESYQEPKRSSGAEGVTGAIHRTDHCTASATSWQRRTQGHTCIATSMNLPGGVFRRALMSIMRMVTGTTMIHQTLSQYPQESMQSIMAIPATAFPRLAMNAAIRLSQRLIVPNGAALLVRSGAGGSMALPTSSHEAQPFLSRTRAKNADRGLSQPNHGPCFVPLSVEEVTAAGTGEVWNLSVDEVHEYVANGVLVNNSLRNAAMRFGAALDLWHKGELHRDDDQPTPDELARPDAGFGPARQDPAPRTDTGGATITPPQQRILAKALERKGLAEHTLTDAFGIAALDQLPAASINDAIAWVGSQDGAA